MHEIKTLSNNQLQIAGRKLLSTKNLEMAALKHGITPDSIMELMARYLGWIDEEMTKGRTSFVARDVMKIMDFFKDWAIHKEKLGLDKQAYEHILAQGNEKVREQHSQLKAHRKETE